MKKKENLDEVDTEILHLLFSDGRMSLKELGLKVKAAKGSVLSHVAIKNRLDKLQPNLIHIQANLNLKKLGFVSAIILIETKDYDTQRKLIERARLCPRIASIDILSGKVNVMMRLVAQTLKELDCFIVNNIQTDDMIRDFELLHCRQSITPRYHPLKLPAFEHLQHPNTPCGHNCRFCMMYKDNTCPGCPASEFYTKEYRDYLSL